MNNSVQTYLSKRANLERHTLVNPDPPAELQFVIVIPAIAEEETLPVTLDSLGKCSSDLLDRSLVIVVINNRVSDVIEPVIIEENQRTLRWLESRPYPNLHLAYIDASSPGLELAKKEGVGGARKIGMDHAADQLLKSDSASSLIICLDADTLVEPDYLDGLLAFASSQNPWAAVIDYAHTIPEDPQQQAAIVSYELFLRYQELGMRFANSPYAFHTIGSTIACTPTAYAAVAGMNRRSAGEDFYFLQQLKKTGTVARITCTTVQPSSRVSWRVPFGTGKRVGRFMEGAHAEYEVYHPDSYRILRNWLALASENIGADGIDLVENARGVHPELYAFLDQIGFVERWDKIWVNSPSHEQKLNQFHCYFNAFKSLKLIHHLRDTALPNQNTFDALRSLRPALDISPDIQHDLSQQIVLLDELRKSMRETL